MSEEQDDEAGTEPPYVVGYGKPPKATRFMAGNKAASKRRKASKSQNDEIACLFTKKVTIRENGKQRKVTVLQAIVLRILADSMAGKASATKQALQLAQQARDEPTASVLDILLKEDQQILSAFMQISTTGNEDA